MPNFTRLASQSELPSAGEAKEFFCGDKTVCVANVNGRFSAMDNVCPHRGGSLGQGIVENGKVVCPWHGWQFDPITGESTHNPKAKLSVYVLEFHNPDVLIEI
jgi:nitrite reductase (NADH) small subunit